MNDMSHHDGEPYGALHQEVSGILGSLQSGKPLNSNDKATLENAQKVYSEILNSSEKDSLYLAMIREQKNRVSAVLQNEVFPSNSKAA